MCDYRRQAEGVNVSQRAAMMHSVICDTVNLIEIKLQNDLRIDRLARRAGYMRWHFQRFFKKSPGIRFRSMSASGAHVKATEAIIDTQKRMTAIACDAGYRDQQLMSRLLRATFGMSPRELRHCASTHADSKDRPAR